MRGSRPGERGAAGRKRGTKNRATIERALIAEQIMVAAERTGAELAANPRARGRAGFFLGPGAEEEVCKCGGQFFRCSSLKILRKSVFNDNTHGDRKSVV